MSTKSSNYGWGRNPSEMLAHVARGEFDDAIRRWLAAGAAAYEREDRRIPLDRLLGLPRGKRARQIQRDFWLRQAFDLCIGTTPFSKVIFLAGEIAKFRRRLAWYMRPIGLIEESELSDLRLVLRRVFGQGCQVPESTKQLLRIVMDTTGQKTSATLAHSELMHGET